MPRSAPIEGRATFTTVMSRTTMNCATERRISADQGRRDSSGWGACTGDLAAGLQTCKPYRSFTCLSTHDRLARRPIRRQADHPLGEAGRSDPEGGVEPVEVDDRQVRGDLDQLLVAEVLLHAREQLVGDLYRRSHHADRVVQRQLLALGEQLAPAVARQGQQLLVGEARVATDLRAEVDAVLAADHLRALELDQVLEPL